MNIKCPQCGIAHNCNFCPSCGTPATIGKIKKKGMSAWGIVLTIFLSIFGFILFIVLLFGFMSMRISNLKDKASAIIESDRQGTTITKSNILEPKELLFKPGDVISSDKMEVTINRVDFSYDVLPDDTNSFYTHYEADDGEVYIHIDTDVKNLSKKDLGCDDILTVKADYDNGFVYRGFAIVESTMTGFTYASITSINPLKTKGIHFLISCPEEVAESDKPLFIELKLSGTNDVYKYTIR